MKCIVTAGPTYQALDEVRRLTNLSTGTLGSELANFLSGKGHEVDLLLGYYATYRGPQKAARVHVFTTTADLHRRLQEMAGAAAKAVFHAAAVSDFTFGRTWLRSAAGELKEIKSAKIATDCESVLAELVPTPKIIRDLRPWFPQACIVGGKYELEGDRRAVVTKALTQIMECNSNACVANGRAYGNGFGLVTPDRQCAHFEEMFKLFPALMELAAAAP